MSKTSRSAAVQPSKSVNPAQLRWWQIRTSDYVLFLLAIILQRVLILPIVIIAMTSADGETLLLNETLDRSFSGLHPPTLICFILILSWTYFAVCLATAFLEKPYHVLKIAIIFGAGGIFLFLTARTFLTLFSDVL